MEEERQSADTFVRSTKFRENFELHYAELVKQSKPIIFPLFELPFQRNNQFTGREEQLTQISDYLSQQSTLAITNSIDAILTQAVDATRAQAIAGLGGVGKSQLAIEYAYQAYEKKSYQIIWFMNGQNLTTDYLSLAEQLRVYGENKNDIIERVKRKLQELGNYLLIIDDAENYETIRDYLPQTGKNGHVLITTRHRADWQKMLELGVFTLVEALEYFKKVTDFKEEEREDVIKLVDKLLGLLPLALTQAGAFIKQTGIPVKEYIEFFETKRKELWGIEDKPRDYSQTITVTWDITINRIKDTHPQAEDLLRGMSCLASIPNKIDQSWLSGLVIDEQVRITTLGELAAYSMIEKPQDINHFTVHSLVQEVVFEKIPYENQKNYLWSVLKLLRESFSYNHNISKNTNTTCLPHIITAADRTKKIAFADNELKELLDLLIQAGQFQLIERNDFKECIKFLELAKIKLEVLKNDKNLGKKSVVLSCLTYCYFLMNEKEKLLPLLLQVLVFEDLNREKFLKENKYGAAVISWLLGEFNLAQGNYLEAIKYFDQAKNIYRKIFKSDGLAIANIFRSLGDAYQCGYRLEMAEDYFKQAKSIYEQHYGQQNHPQLAVVNQEFGNILFRKMKGNKLISSEKNTKNYYIEAHEYFLQALNIRKQVYGDAQNVALAITYIDLGDLNLEVGDFHLAQQYYNEANKNLIFDHNQDKYPYYLARLKLSRGYLAYFVAKNTKENKFSKLLYQLAKDFYEEALECYKKIWGIFLSDDIANVYSRLGELYYQQGIISEGREQQEFFVRAMSSYSKALNIKEKLGHGEEPIPFFMQTIQASIKELSTLLEGLKSPKEENNGSNGFALDISLNLLIFLARILDPIKLLEEINSLNGVQVDLKKISEIMKSKPNLINFFPQDEVKHQKRASLENELESVLEGFKQDVSRETLFFQSPGQVGGWQKQNQTNLDEKNASATSSCQPKPSSL